MILSSEFWTSQILRQTQQSESHVEDLTKDAKLSVCSPKRYNKCGGRVAWLLPRKTHSSLTL